MFYVLSDSVVNAIFIYLFIYLLHMINISAFCFFEMCYIKEVDWIDLHSMRGTLVIKLPRMHLSSHNMSLASLA